MTIINNKQKIALFDADETLLSTNSKLDFIRFFYLEHYGHQLGKIKFDKYRISQLWNKYKREALNRLYYTNFKDIAKTTLEDLGKKWFEQALSSNDPLFKPLIIDRVNRYKRDGFRVILVSSSFFAPLNPIIEYLGINELLCTKPITQDDVLTGEIGSTQTIGQGKVDAILNHLKEDQIDWCSSFAFGDHISDFEMLKLVGNPVVVGRNRTLLQIAKERNWEFIL